MDFLPVVLESFLFNKAFPVSSEKNGSGPLTVASEEDTYSTVFSVLKHPVRRRIVRMLSAKPCTYTEILRALNVETGYLNYHLESMRELIAKDEQGKYSLSVFGEAAASFVTRVEEPDQERKRVRPAGVTALAILQTIAGVLPLAIALPMIVMIGSASTLVRGIQNLSMIFPTVWVFMVIPGVLSLVIAYGLWTGRELAWTIAYVFAILGIILGIVSLPSGVITIIINGVTIYYLTRPHVKEFFGKGVKPPLLPSQES